MLQVDERAYFQRRLREEIARSERFHDRFGVALIEASPSPGYVPTRRSCMVAARQLEHRLRACDVVTVVYDDTIAILLIATDTAGLQDAEHRIRAVLTGAGGSWRISTLGYPGDREAILRLEVLTAA